MKLEGLRVDELYKRDPNLPKHEKLQQSIQFSMPQDAKINQLSKGSFDEYSGEVDLPPYWKVLPNVNIGDKFLGKFYFIFKNYFF